MTEQSGKKYAKTDKHSDDVLSAKEAHGKPASVPLEVSEEFSAEPSREGGIPKLQNKKNPK